MSVSSSCPPQSPQAPQTARRFAPLEPPGWQSAAACAGLPPRVVFSKKVKEAAPALRACAGCTVRRHCEEAVAPAESWFDGVCGGRLWRSGRPVLLSANGKKRAARGEGSADGGRVARGAGRAARDGSRVARGERRAAHDGGHVV